MQACASLSGRGMKGTAPSSPSGAMGSTVLHSQNQPVGAGAPKSATGTQLVGHTSPWEAASALLYLLGPFCCLIQSSPAFPGKEQVSVCLFPCVASSTQGFATADANGQFYLLFHFLQLFSPCSAHLPGLALASSAERFQANITPLRGRRSQSNEKG